MPPPTLAMCNANPGEVSSLVRRWAVPPPALVLFFLAPAIGELLSSSAPPAEFFNPFMLLVLSLLYGGGAILIREATLRWRKGWPTLLLLGAAYGIVEEGLMVKSFFDPNWPDLGDSAGYARWHGVNWHWSINLTLYHAVFSIAVPILLTGLIFRRQRARPWVGRRGLWMLGALLAADVAFGFFLLTSYRPPLVPYALSALIALALCLLARALPHPLIRRNPGPPAPVLPRWLGLAAFAATLAFFVIAWGSPGLGVPATLSPLLPVLFVAICIALYWRLSGRGTPLSDRHQLTLAAGLLTFFILLAPIWELNNASRPDNTTGMTLVGLAAAFLLIWLHRRNVRVPVLPEDSESSRSARD